MKSDADSENDTSKMISQRLRVVLMDFNVNGVVFGKIFIFFRLSRVGYHARG